MKRLSVLFLISLLSFSCKNEPKFEYKYSDKDDLFSCPDNDSGIIKEAVYVFEDYVTTYHAPYSRTTFEGYLTYCDLVSLDRAPEKAFFNDHLIAVRNYLINQDHLWIKDGDKFKLNYNNELVNCIINSIEDQRIKKTIIVLIESNTLKPEVLAPLIIANKQQLEKDKALATYFILETFYTKLFYMESPNYVETVIPKPEFNFDNSKLIPIEKPKKEKDDHEGHNH